MNKINQLIFLSILCVSSVFSQTIQGVLPQAKNREIVLMSYNGFTTKDLSKTTTDAEGNFILNYPNAYKGVAIFQIKGVTSIIVLLNNEELVIQWNDFQNINLLKFSNSSENDAFAKGISINQEAEEKLAGLKYLLTKYKNETKQKKWLHDEINKNEKANQTYLKTLANNSYAKQYLEIRKLLADMQLTNERYKEETRIIKHEKDFKKLDITSDAIWHSGLLQDLILTYYQLLENYENKIVKINEYNNVWLQSKTIDNTRKQELAEYCFKLLEEKNFTKASEHIALSMFNQENCTLDDKRTDLFEQYRKLAIGKTAPDIDLTNNQKLSTINTTHKLVVFGASWCPNCQSDYPSLVGKYKTLKELYDLEIIYISIDTDKNSFESYYKEAPFITFCDAKGWETQAAKDYHVFATPTYILLDTELKINAKIKSPEHLEKLLKEMVEKNNLKKY